MTATDTGTDTGTSVSPDARRLWRRGRGLLIAAAALLITGLVLALLRSGDNGTLHPGSANQTVGICAAALPERRIPSPLLCPALPCLACHCCVFFCRSAPACCDRPPASAATPRPSTPIAAVQCGPPAAQSRQNSSIASHRIA